VAVGAPTPYDAKEIPSRLGRYVVLGEAGRGGMGVVFRAYDPKLRREVAVKRLTSEHEDLHSERTARLIREAQSLAKLSHPNVVGVYDVDVELGLVAMEFIDGKTMQQWLRDGSHTLQELLDVLRQAGRGLAAAHAVGLVHRDFKPGNVLIGSDGRVRVSDFGLARGPGGVADNDEMDSEEDRATQDSDSLTGSGVCLGTPAYMAPEQHEGTATAASDQFSFCSVCWEALTECRPFRDRGKGLLESKLRGPPRWSGSRRVGRRIQSALRRGLSVRAEDRWPSIDPIIDVLEGKSSRSKALMLSVGGLGLVAAAILGSPRDDRCSGGPDVLGEVWNPARRDQLDASLAEPRVTAAIERYAERWTHAFEDSCKATVIREELPEAVMQLRMTCLYEQRTALETVVGLAEHWGAERVDETIVLVDSLPDLKRCADVATLVDERDATASVPAEFRYQLAELWTLLGAGELDRVSDQLDNLESQGNGDAPQRLWFSLVRGRLLRRQGKYDAAIVQLQTARQLALELGMDRMLLFSTHQLAAVLGNSTSSPEEGLRLSGDVLALVSRIDPGGEGEASALALRGSLLLSAGRYEDGRAEYQSALHIIEDSPPDSIEAKIQGDVFTGLSLACNYLGDKRQASDYMGRARSVFETRYGPRHLLVAQASHNLGGLLISEDRIEDGIVALERAESIRLARLGPEHPDLVSTWSNLAVAHHRLGHEQRSTEYAERARELELSTSGETEKLAAILFNLGTWTEGQRGVELQREALRIRVAVHAPDHPKIIMTRLGLAERLVDLGQHEAAQSQLDAARASRGGRPLEVPSLEAYYKAVEARLGTPPSGPAEG
jgi:serine/threonine protein kinase/tetratricopeptide (TPR) repeat protein